ncbi:MAG: hypothetical protein SCK28_08255 [Bacillota bacterium]|nr:hypothetical protein [Bacillota bacterium]
MSRPTTIFEAVRLYKQSKNDDEVLADARNQVSYTGNRFGMGLESENNSNRK